MTSFPTSEPGEALFSTAEMSAIFSSAAHVGAMLTFEAALARAEAHANIIPQEAAAAIAISCRVELFDVAALYREAAQAGTPAIPLVRMLTAQVAGDARKFVHWGATSQDTIDSALMLQMRDGLSLLVNGLLGICEACATLAERYRETPMVGRTLLQQALPITFGLKAAHWLTATTRQVRALRERQKLSLAVQLGGAAGTLASLGNEGPRVVELLASDLGLPAPELPWHTGRERIAEIATTLGSIAGTMAKIADDVALLAQTEIGEASEGSAPGKGGSSAMPQKHNPVDAVGARAAARLAIGVVPVILSAMEQEHERAAGGWQAEWAAIPALFRYTAGAVERVRLAYNVDGPEDAPTIVMVNSLGTDLRIVRYDCRGHGASQVPNGPYSIEQFGLDLLALLDMLHIQRAHLCGLSLGGVVALLFAANHPERIKRAIFANTAARIGNNELWNARIDAVNRGGMAAIKDAVLVRFLSADFREHYPETAHQIGEMVAATNPVGYLGACAALRDADLSELVGTIRVPSLILAGELDESTPLEQGRELHTAIAGSELAIFRKTAHLSNIEQPEEFSRYLQVFITEGN